MKKLVFLGLVIISYSVYGIYISFRKIQILPPLLKTQNPAGYYDYRGVTHLHSQRSSGSGTIAEIVSAAKEAGIDFLFITDLNQITQNPENCSQPVPLSDFTCNPEEQAAGATLPSSQGSYDGYHDNLLVAEAREYSYLDAHLLFYTPDPPQDFSSLGNAQIHFTDLLSQQNKDPSQGLLVLAHPLQPGYARPQQATPGLDGIELINLNSVWESSFHANPGSFLWSLFIYPFNSELALLRLYKEPAKELNLWHDLNEGQKTVALVGNDTNANAILFPGFSLEFPSYKESFLIASNHLLLESELTGQFERDKKKIIQALQQGQFYLSLDLLGDPRGFYSQIRTAHETFPIGSTVKLTHKPTLEFHLPRPPQRPFSVKIFHEQKEIHNFEAVQGQVPLRHSGHYRVEVSVRVDLPLPDGPRWYRWIYTNFFEVTP